MDPYADPEIARLRAEAVAMAGGIGDLVQRASVYHHLYEHSGANHAFPLLAAHGALWASGYFKAGMRFGAIAASIQKFGGADEAELKRRLLAFANQFRDINRRVCVETYFIYHLTADDHFRHTAERIVPTALLTEMDRCHAARRAGRVLSDAERRPLFSAFFLWEQANIVGPSIDAAFAGFDWPFIKAMALTPRIRFAYFHPLVPVAFRNFGDTDERIAAGIEAFDRACAAGWERVERRLSAYGIMPADFTRDSRSFFDSLRTSVVGRLAPA
jgi:hypothetical protein